MRRKASRKASRKGSAQLKGNELMQAARRGSVVAAEIAVEGFLEKKAATLTGAEKYQSRYFVLAGHYLRYYADRQSAADGKPKGMFDINAMQRASHRSMLTLASSTLLSLAAPAVFGRRALRMRGCGWNICVQQ